MGPSPPPSTAHRRHLSVHALSLLRRLATATHEWQRTEVEGGFTVNQALVLHHLVMHGDATPSGLASWMHVTRGSITPTVQRLEELGLVTRRVDAHDARKQWLTATPEAFKVAPDVEKRILRPVFNELREWRTEELSGLCASLERLLSSNVFGGK